MAQVSDVKNIVTSGLTYIDALLNTGPGWNYLTPATNNIAYTFSIASGNESDVSGQQAFNDAQKTATRGALDYISGLTGITFSETVNGTAASIHFCLINIADTSTTGYCSWSYGYSSDSNDTITTYSAEAYVYLDNVEWLSQNSNLTPGGYGYETLLHEMGHALGLKHPFEKSPTLPSDQDNTTNTLMSYTSKGGPYSTFSPYDVAALNWIYGGDGLSGALGINSTSGGRYWTGTDNADLITAGSGNDFLKGEAGNDTLTGGTGNDTLSGGTGNDAIDGGSGTDTAVYANARAQYTIALNAANFQVDNSSEGLDTLTSVERLKFSDMSVALDIDGHAGSTARILGLVFGKEAVSNKTYAGIGLNYLDGGMSYQDLLQLALNAKLGDGYSNSSEVNLIYQNLVSSLPATADLNYWTGTISSGLYSQISLAVMAANLDLNAANINLVGLARTGLEYV
ncbi:MAG: M12 family metallo-peptidase [Methylobacter sp.]